MIAHGTDKSYRTLSAFQVVIPGRPAAFDLFGFGQTVMPGNYILGLPGGNYVIPVPILQVANGHKLNKTYVQRTSIGQVGEGHYLIVIESPDQNSIDLDRVQIQVQCLVDGLPYRVQVSHPSNVLELFRYQRIQAEVDPVKAGRFQFLSHSGEQYPIGGQRYIVDLGDFLNIAYQLGDISSYQGFSPGQPHLPNTGSSRYPNQPGDFLQG